MKKGKSITEEIIELIESVSNLDSNLSIRSSSVVTNQKTKGQGSANVRINSNELYQQEYIKKKVARVSYSRKIKRITLERYLVSKIVHHPEKTSFEDLLVIYDNILYLQDICERDPGFSKKFGKTLEVLAKILKSHRFSQTNFLGTIRSFSKELKGLEGFVLPERNLQGTERHLRGLFHIIPYKEQGISTSRLPPKAYIGVGYSDKGHRTDPAYDGSPHWTDVIKGGVE